LLILVLSPSGLGMSSSSPVCSVQMEGVDISVWL
jgi:hypothetical protein